MMKDLDDLIWGSNKPQTQTTTSKSLNDLKATTTSIITNTTTSTPTTAPTAVTTKISQWDTDLFFNRPTKNSTIVNYLFVRSLILVDLFDIQVV